MSTLEKISEESVDNWSYSGERTPPSNMLCALVLEKFQQITQYYFLFHAGFFALALVELFSSIVLFSFVSKSSLLALLLAALLLTAFTYLVLLFYFQAKKPEQMIEIKETFLEAYKKQSGGESLAELIYGMTALLDENFYNQELPFKQFPSLQLLMRKLRIWSTWRDLHKMKEVFLMILVNEQVGKIKSSPLDLEAHAALGSAYLALSKLCLPDANMLWVPPQYHSAKMGQKFQFFAHRALEEFKILDTLSADDLWVHAQLASLYHSLELLPEEIAEYETMQKIAPQDPQILTRLGTLYFHQGKSAKGLQVYQELILISEEHAGQLLATYDAYTDQDIQFD